MESSQAVESGVPVDEAPDWVGAWMPQRHVEIAAEIERLREEARQIESLGRLLWQEGLPLHEAVKDVFQSVGLRAELTPQSPAADVIVALGEGKRLLISVEGTEHNITNRSTKIKQVFEASQQLGDGDRVVLAANVHRTRPVADREWLDPVTEEALMIIKGVGAIFVTTATLYRVWSMAKERPEAAAEPFLYMHAAAAGALTIDSDAGEKAPMESDEVEEPAGAGLTDRLVSALKS